jgi:hypothetical protein
MATRLVFDLLGILRSFSLMISCQVFRNVRDYGAKGDGKADDTVAINRAITDGGRCGQLCGSSMKKPAVVYFPSGTYLVSSSIIQYYNTQFLGNVSSLNCVVLQELGLFLKLYP